MSGEQRICHPLVIVSCKAHEKAAIEAGAMHVAVVDVTRGGEQIMAQVPGRERLRVGFEFEKYIIGLPAKKRGTSRRARCAPWR